jgi:hypothetical protein
MTVEAKIANSIMEEFQAATGWNERACFDNAFSSVSTLRKKKKLLFANYVVFHPMAVRASGCSPTPPQ